MIILTLEVVIYWFYKMLESELFACISKINRDLVLFHIEIKQQYELKNITISTRGQGLLKEHLGAPIIFAWVYKWIANKVKHEVTFEMWKDEQWRLKSVYNTDDRSDLDNPQKSDFLFDYYFENLNEMLQAFEKIETKFIEILKQKLAL